MCVICVKSAGHALPTKALLRAMYNHNQDGCGFVSKSLSYHSMDFEDFYSVLQKVPKKEACIIHFRWATHGSVNISNCHPFHDDDTGVWFAHNGVLPIRPKKDMTDSETAFRNVLIPVIKRYGYMSDKLSATACRIIGGSRFAFMKDGRVRLFGQFYKYGGCLYSNLRFLPWQDEVALMHRNAPRQWRTA